MFLQNGSEGHYYLHTISCVEWYDMMLPFNNYKIVIIVAEVSEMVANICTITLPLLNPKGYLRDETCWLPFPPVMVQTSSTVMLPLIM